MGRRARTPPTPASAGCCSAGRRARPPSPSGCRCPPTSRRWPRSRPWQDAGALALETATRGAAPAARGTHVSRTARRPPLHAHARHRLAAHVVLRADPRRGAAREHGGRGRAGGAGHGRRGQPGRRACRDHARPRARQPRPSRRPAVPDGRPAGRAPRSARWSTRCSSTPTRRPPTCTPSCGATSTSSGAGGRSTPPPTSWPRRCCRCSTPRWARWPAGLTLADIAARATGCASSTSSSRWSAATARPRPARRPAPGEWPTCCADTSPPTTRCGPTPTGWSHPSLGGQLLRGYLSGSIDVVLRVGAGQTALRGRRLQDQLARRPRARR